MAKKKHSQRQTVENPNLSSYLHILSIQTKEIEKPDKQKPIMEKVEDPADEKLRNLKSLNERLVKQAVENRQQINTLQKSKAELESQISRFQTENKELEVKLMEVKAKMKKEIDKVKVQVKEANQLKKMKIKEKLNEIQQIKLKFDGVLQEKSELQDEINRDLVRERDVVSEIEKKFDLQVKKSMNLKVKISELEKNQVSIRKKLSEVEMENEKLVQEKKAAEKKLAESSIAFDDLKQDKERIAFQKEKIEKNRLYLLAKMYDLEKHVQKLVATIASLEKNDNMLRNKVAEENKERDEAFQGLLFEKGFIEQKLVDSGKMLEELKREKEEIVAEKNKIEKNRADQSVKVALENVKWRKGYTEALGKQQLLKVELESQRKKIVEEKDVIERSNMKMENEIEELRNELGALEISVFQLEKSYKDQMDTNKSLNDNLKRAAAENIEIQKELELKKKEELSLSLKVKELENSMDHSVKEIEKQNKGADSLSVEMKKLETRSEILIQEKSLLKMKLVEVEMGNQSLTSKMESAQMNAVKALLMLKDAAQVMCSSVDEEKEASVESDIDMMKIVEDVLPFASELESIKKAFKNKDRKMEEMTQLIEKLNKSAKKNYNVWALVSSATTILAAAAATYIARGW
ncbi:hypothetical protein MKX03_037431 [Papaver bracteatum]|nr:hypothetical protein MKX03_037431 [Papaver bracteatum]